jgi:predicted AAA+ superfamily ATPase
MIKRHLFPQLQQTLDDFPAVALLGARQVGKTTLALRMGAQYPGSVYLDLESPSDRQKLVAPEAYFDLHASHLVMLDEVQQMPALFQVLRGVIDRGRRAGLKSRRFLLLGSASGELLRQSGESLAGRVAYLELPPLQMLELGADQQDKLWLRGGFPDSYLAASDAKSLVWRQNLISTYLERDIPSYGTRVPAETLRRLWTMLAHLQGGLLDVSKLGKNLMIDAKTVHRYLDMLVDLMLLRRLQPWHSNAGKRLVKSAKLYVRDSGLVHALLGIASMDALLSHPVLGNSWEGFVVENLLNTAPLNTSIGFYRSSNGAEVDLVLDIPGTGLWAIEIKRGAASKPRRGFYSACEDLQPVRRWMVHGGADRYPLGDGVEAIGLHALAGELQHLRTTR